MDELDRMWADFAGSVNAFNKAMTGFANVVRRNMFAVVEGGGETTEDRAELRAV